jgi:hypothetical protein
MRVGAYIGNATVGGYVVSGRVRYDNVHVATVRCPGAVAPRSNDSRNHGRRSNLKPRHP